jgi:hypothetical protein
MALAPTHTIRLLFISIQLFIVYISWFSLYFQILLVWWISFVLNQKSLGQIPHTPFHYFFKIRLWHVARWNWFKRSHVDHAEGDPWHRRWAICAKPCGDLGPDAISWSAHSGHGPNLILIEHQAQAVNTSAVVVH